jgi:hypothetical protein
MTGTLEVAGDLRRLMAVGAGTTLDDAGFDRLARAVFARQFEGCKPYRKFCERRGRAPGDISHWSEIPAVPTGAFKEMELISDPAPVVRVFETSGTTGAARGRHLFSEHALDLYRASLHPTFLHYLLPDLERFPAASADAPTPRSSLLPVVLGPRASELPTSSLFFMIDEVCRRYFSTLPRHVFGSDGLDHETLHGALVESESTGRPLMLLGTALAYQAVCEWLAGSGERFFLPEGSRAMETGGTKGLRVATTPKNLRAALDDRLGLDPRAIVSEYGMTEACSQFYEGTLRDLEESCEVDPRSEENERRFKFGPPWVRALVCDPETLDPAPPGTTGVLRLFDLANLYSISFLQTEDLALAPEPGDAGPGSAPFVYLGRVAGAEARGCSLVSEEWMRATGGPGS